jgi:hypothetical protein
MIAQLPGLTFLVLLTGCRGVHLPHTLTTAERTELYAAVLREVRPTAAARPVVVDTLLPTRELDAEQYEKVATELSTNRATLDAFLSVQRRQGDQFTRDMVPSTEWTAVAPRTLDSLRAAARADAVAGDRSVRTDGFWQKWQTRFPRSGGYITLSPASVSRDGLEALIYVRIACGATCGESELRLLRRDANGAWHTHKRVTLSVS